nr:dihydroorotase [Thermoflexibacter sp.]
MNDLLLKSVQIIDSQSPFHLQRTNLALKDGWITAISPIDETIEVKQILDCTKASLSVGWFDMRASVPDPGMEYKESIESACEAAMAGGFTGVAVLPNSLLPTQSKEGVHFLIQRTANKLCDFFPIAAVSLDLKGEEMTEMYDLHSAGAVAFSDGFKPITNSELIVKTLQYLQQFDGFLMNYADEKNLSKNGMMHEGIHSTLLGMKGIPALAEQMGITRDLQLMSYVGGKIHFSGISSAQSVQLIREAKAKGMQVSCDIAAHQLAFTDEDLKDFDTNLKVKPPFRTKQDIEALIDGLIDGTIDVIVSDHQPQDEESKNLEFDLAEFGIIGLETAFATANTYKE